MSERPRIIGSEMEWPMTVRLANNENPSQFTDTNGLQNRLPDGLVNVTGNFMLSNGGRYYKDVGDRVEYATPETTSFDDLVVRELAGEQIVMHSLLDYAKSHEKVDMLVLSKRVNDTFSEGWGYHLNLSADRSRIPSTEDENLHLLALHLATSSPMLGGGSIFHDQTGNLRYSFSQKVLSLTGDYINGTTGTNKPLVNQRDESHAKEMGLRRIHMTSVDPNISPWATKMTAGTYSLVLGAIEQGKGRDLRLVRRTGNHALISLARQVALDLNMKKTFEMEGIGSIKALDLQEKILGIVQDTEHTDEEAVILREWERAHDILQSRPEQLTQSDALGKLTVMRTWMERNEADDFNHNDILKIDDVMSRLFTYHKSMDANASRSVSDIYNRSRAAKLRGSLFKADMPSPLESITTAITEPPTTTRAYGRGKAIAKMTVKAADWEYYQHAGEPASVQIQDPYIPDLGNAAQPEQPDIT